MRWFKHLSASQDDEAMSELIDEFGPSGYGIWWVILEKIALGSGESNETRCRYSARRWANFAGTTPHYFRKVIYFLDKKIPNFCIEDDGRYIQIDCPNILKYRDEYTQKKKRKQKNDSGHTPDMGADPYPIDVPLEQRQSTETETEAETEVQEGTTRPASASLSTSNGVPLQQIMEFWNQALEENDSPLPRLKQIRQGTQRQKHVRARWKENPDIETWKAVIQKAAVSDFLNGRVKEWQASFDWIIKSPDNFTKVLEGNYDNKDPYAKMDKCPF